MVNVNAVSSAGSSIAKSVLPLLTISDCVKLLNSKKAADISKGVAGLNILLDRGAGAAEVAADVATEIANAMLVIVKTTINADGVAGKKEAIKILGRIMKEVTVSADLQYNILTAVSGNLDYKYDGQNLRTSTELAGVWTTISGEASTGKAKDAYFIFQTPLDISAGRKSLGVLFNPNNPNNKLKDPQIIGLAIKKMNAYIGKFEIGAGRPAVDNAIETVKELTEIANSIAVGVGNTVNAVIQQELEINLNALSVLVSAADKRTDKTPESK